MRERDHLEDQGVEWDDNINLDLVNEVMNLRVP